MHAVDWLPTIASLAGYETKAVLKWDGVNQWPALNGAPANPAPRMIYIAMRKGHALRYGDWKLVAPGEKESQLFNLANDPYEKSDLAAAEPAKVAELQKLLTEQRAKDDPKLPADLVGVHD
jgi:arylsulfatase A-like enzyme